MKRQNELVINAAASPSFAVLTCNLSPASVRLETLEDKEYVVVPMVILTEGVHNGSSGPLYYPPEELQKTPVAWNHKPVVVYHPTMNGEPLSASEPHIINSRRVGLMLNTRWEGGKLKSEAWLDRIKADKVDARIMASVDNQESMELSTGVFIDVDKTPGNWNGEAYVGIARNFRADHLALLPDQVGACSLEDGAGLLRNVEKAGLWPSLKKFLASIGVTNAISHNQITKKLSEALKKRFNPSDAPGANIWIEEVYDDEVVYSVGMDSKFWRLEYTMEGDKITLSGDAPEEVVRTIDYESATDNKDVSTNKTKQNTMNKKAVVDMIINAGKGWEESDRAALMGLNDQQLTIVQNSLTPPAPVVPAAAPAPAPAAAPAPVANTTPPSVPAPKVVTVDEYIGAAPAGIQDVLRNAQSVYSDEKNRLIEAITKNANNGFTKQDLEGRPLGELKNLARLAGFTAPAAPNYSGMAPTQTANASTVPALEIPTMTFDKK